MVTGRCGALLILIGAILAACKQPAATADLCFSTRVGMGQNLQTLYCGKDSCYLMVFAANIPRPASVALFGVAVPRDTLALGDALILAYLKEESPPSSHRAAMITTIERNGVSAPLPRDPGTDDRISRIKEWMYNRNDEARSRPPLWRDSLILDSVSADPREVAIRLSSGHPQSKSPFGSVMSLRIVYPKVGSGGKERVELPTDSLAGLVSSGTLKYKVPPLVDSLEAAVKVRSTKDSVRLPHACLEGVFELRSKGIGF